MKDVLLLINQTKEKFEKINKLKEEIDNLWKPILEKAENMSEDELLEILHNTNFYQQGFHIQIRDIYRKKFG